MATFSLNTTVKVNTGVNVAGSGSYTAPSAGYAILNVANADSSPHSVTVSSKTIPIPALTNVTVYVGPSEQFVSGNGNITATGVEFLNSP